MRYFGLGGLVVFLSLVSAGNPAGATPACLACHSAPTMDKSRVTQQTLADSVHAELECLRCHAGMPSESVPHDIPLPKVNCMRCHGSPPQGGASKSADPVRHGKRSAPADLLPGCASCHGTHDIRSSEQLESTISRQNVVETCATCHGPQGQAAKLIGDEQVINYRQSVHGQPKLSRPGLFAAVCTDCHGDHVILPAEDANSPVHRTRVPETCGRCHSEALRDFRQSIHGQALAKGVKDAPSCTDCHGEHRIVGTQQQDSPVSGRNVIETCAKCHADMTLVRKYDLPVGSVESYRRSYHGVANRFGQIEVASCVSCHSAHLILPEDHRKSWVHPANLPKTCGTPDCHPGIGPNVTRGSIHVAPSPTSDRPVYWVTVAYVLFIWVLILSFVTMVALDIYQHWRRDWKVHDPDPTIPMDKAEVHRFTRNQLWQHGILLVSFVLLLLTGFPIRFAESAASGWLIEAFGGITFRANLHRLMAIVLISVCAWHAVWTVATRQGRSDFLKMLPEMRDIGRALGMIKYYFGFAREMPGFGRFNLIEKFEYLAMGWGSAVMIVTGFALWFPSLTLRYLPKWALDVCHVVHGYEAVLAFLAITIWHFYHVHFKPGIFPMSRIWLDGKVELAELRHEHREEYERLKKELAPSRSEIAPAEAAAEEEGVETTRGIETTSPEEENVAAEEPVPGEEPPPVTPDGPESEEEQDS